MGITLRFSILERSRSVAILYTCISRDCWKMTLQLQNSTSTQSRMDLPKLELPTYPWSPTPGVKETAMNTSTAPRSLTCGIEYFHQGRIHTSSLHLCTGPTQECLAIYDGIDFSHRKFVKIAFFLLLTAPSRLYQKEIWQPLAHSSSIFGSLQTVSNGISRVFQKFTLIFLFSNICGYHLRHYSNFLR